MFKVIITYTNGVTQTYKGFRTWLEAVDFAHSEGDHVKTYDVKEYVEEF